LRKLIPGSSLLCPGAGLAGKILSPLQARDLIRNLLTALIPRSAAARQSVRKNLLGPEQVKKKQRT